MVERRVRGSQEYSMPEVILGIPYGKVFNANHLIMSSIQSCLYLLGELATGRERTESTRS